MLDTEEEKKEKDTYYIYTRCANCNSLRDASIPMGISAGEYLKDRVCNYCGMTTIEGAGAKCFY